MLRGRSPVTPKPLSLDPKGTLGGKSEVRSGAGSPGRRISSGNPTNGSRTARAGSSGWNTTSLSSGVHTTEVGAPRPGKKLISPMSGGLSPPSGGGGSGVGSGGTSHGPVSPPVSAAAETTRTDPSP